MDADLVLTGSPVHGASVARSPASAVAVRGGRVAAVGDEREIRDLVGPNATVIEVRGGLIVPGLQDAHVHPLEGGLSGFRCSLHDLSGKEAYLEAIAEYARAHSDEEWIRGDGWSMTAFPRGTPNRKDLDGVVPDRPVFLVNADGHGAWVNSKALERAGVKETTPDPIDGRIERDEEGPTGTLHEGAMELVRRHLPPTTRAELVDALRVAQRHLHSLGITAWQDAMVTAPELEAYVDFSNSGELTMRVVLSLLWERHENEDQIAGLIERRAAGTTGRMTANTVKIFQDGVMENFTAGLTEPYLSADGAPTDNAGLSMIDPILLRRYVARLDREGFQVHFHAIGDRAVRESLDAIEAARRANGPNEARHHIAHIQLVHPDDIGRFAELGAIANGQPFWACREPQMTVLTIPFIGPRRAAWQYPFASLLRAGATLAFGSDWPVSTPNPFLEMEVATTRVAVDDRGAEPLLAEERVSPHQAVAAFTTGAAFVNHLDHATGTLEVGKLADIAVLDRNILEPTDRPLGDTKVLMTIVEGEIVYADHQLGLH
jgi:predicted amidohydrolase YtcJ